MVGTSKILTVSYGTFSCTLEGFDDSFNTMKAIAEYFRGLAADDRYFGAEPPTPDAEMLAQIAEREISRRVDARMENDGIVLRAAALTDQSEAEEAPHHTKESRAEVEAARKAAKAARKAEKKAEKAARKAAEKAEAKAKAKAEAEELAKAEAAEAEAEPVEEAAAIEAEVEAVAEPDDAEDGDSDILSSVGAATADAPEGATEPEVEETRDDAPSSMLAAEGSVPAPSTPAPAHPDPDSVAAKLQRIRAVVGKADDDPANDATEPFLPQAETPDVADIEAPIDDADLEEVADFDEDPIADLDAHEAEISAEAEDTGEDAGDEDANGGTDMISRVMARHTQTEDAPEDTPVDEAPEDEAPKDEVTPAEPRARVIRMKREDFDKAVARGEIGSPKAPENAPDLGLLDGADELDDYLEDSDFTDEDLGIDLDQIDDAFSEDDADVAAETDDGGIDVNALNAAFEEDDEDQDEPVAQEGATDEDGDGAMDDDVGAEAETEVEVEAEAEDEVEAEADEEVEGDDDDENAFLAQKPQVDDEALDRLMSETDAQMKEPEGSRRRDAIAQLKAAVAAKEAARQVGEVDDDDHDVENAFRNDLSEAVRPEGAPRPRPVVRATGQRTERPRPAPLKLVAAQRVDLDQAEKRTTPVAPRRVAVRKDDAAARAAGSFAEFAENMGAQELPDLLEAAAAYTSFVEGADEFSRPQILRRVRAVASDEFNREDGLRSFAQLLRSGRFTKVSNGRFQVSDDSRFNPQRAAS